MIEPSMGNAVADPGDDVGKFPVEAEAVVEARISRRAIILFSGREQLD